MKPSRRPPRMPSKLSDSLHHQLNMYALAASASGVALLALVPPSEAKIIYTKTHQVIGINGVYPLDLNHDGIIDFLIKEQASFSVCAGASWSCAVVAKEAFGNAVEGSNGLAAALNKGAPIGPSQQFISNTYSFGELMFRADCSADGSCGSAGQWKGVNNGYLGLKFQIDGKNHYGWARLEGVSCCGGTLTGYAYETIANRKIRAGQTSGNSADTILEPSSTDSAISDPTAATRPPARAFGQSRSLGRLAVGSRQLSQWRRP